MARLTIDLLTTNANSQGALSVIEFATVNIYDRNDDGSQGSASTVYVDGGTTDDTLAQPLSSDEQGRIPGWLVAGDYLIVVSATGYETYTIAYSYGGSGGSSSEAALLILSNNWIPYYGEITTSGYSGGASTTVGLIIGEELSSDGTLAGGELSVQGLYDPGAASSVTAPDAVTLPLTVVESVNDTFSWGGTGGYPSTNVTLAPGTYTTLGDLETAIANANMVFYSPESFNTFFNVSDNGEGQLVFTYSQLWDAFGGWNGYFSGPSQDGTVLAPGNIGSDLGFAGDITFSGGVYPTVPSPNVFYAYTFLNAEFLDQVVTTPEGFTNALLVAATTDGASYFVGNYNSPYPSSDGTMWTMADLEEITNVGGLFSISPDGDGLLINTAANVTITVYLGVAYDSD